LLQVVADDLIRPVALLEPGGMALVKIAPALFRDPGVRHVANERVMEAKGVVVVGLKRLKGKDEALAAKGRQAPVRARELVRRR
jgi:hypothetical protein